MKVKRECFGGPADGQFVTVDEDTTAVNIPRVPIDDRGWCSVRYDLAEIERNGETVMVLRCNDD